MKLKALDDYNASSISYCVYYECSKPYKILSLTEHENKTGSC